MKWLLLKCSICLFSLPMISCFFVFLNDGNQGALAQRRSNFQGNQFPLATEAARKAAAAPLRNRAFGRNRAANWNKTRYFIPKVYLFLILLKPHYCGNDNSLASDGIVLLINNCR